MADVRDRLAAALAGRYTVERELGAGGMATVYLAEDVKHHRRVAIKVLHPELAAALGPERFLREIETTAALRHPHILPLYDSGRTAGPSSAASPSADLLYYVMPYVEGESLRARLDREKQLPLDDALQIAREVADALSYAHSRGVIHRDIKPENILLESGHAVVADFGIARAITAAGGDRLTQTGVAVGTPAYMSPEQGAGSGELDGRSDLYALGCVLYEMLAGQPPFTGPTVASVLNQHLTAEPRAITQIRPAVTAEVAGVLQRALAKNPADRFNPVAQFADALQRPTRGGMVRPVAPRRGWLVVAAVAIVAAVASVVWLMSRGTARLPVIVSTAQVTRDPGLEVDPALSPDGTMIAYASGLVDDMQILVRQVRGGRTVALTSAAGQVFRWPRWSPDGSQIAYQAFDGVRVVPALGGPGRIVYRVDTAGVTSPGSVFTALAGLAWSPDGRRLAVLENEWAALDTGAGANTMSIVGLDDGAIEQLAVPSAAYSPAWSPDGERIALAAGNPIFVFGTAYFANNGASAIWVVSLDGGDPVAITDGTHLDGSPVWSPDGRDLFFVSDRGGSRDVYRVRLERNGAAAGPIERLTTGLDAHTIDLSRDGSRLAYSRLRTFSNIWVMDRPSGGAVSIAAARPVTTGQQTIEDVDVTADGQRLVFDSDRSGNADIYIMPASGGEAVPLTADPAGDFSAAWSPDGRRIVFHSLRSGNRDVFTVNADGTGLTRRTSSPQEELDPDWAWDGRRVAYEVVDATSQWFAVLDLQADTVRRIAAVGDFAQWSPVGDEIAYHALDGIRIVTGAGDTSRLVVDNEAIGAEAFYTAWAPDGRTLYYLARGPEGWSIRSVPAAGGASRVLVRFDDPQRQPTRYGFTTDGDRFYLTIGGHESDVWVMDLERR